MRFLWRIADRTHPLVLPGVWVLVDLTYFGWVTAVHGTASCCWSSVPQLWGTILTYCLIPAYLMASVVYLRRGHLDTVRAVTLTGPASVAAGAPNRNLDSAGKDLPGWIVWITVVGGVIFGIAQYDFVRFGSMTLVNPWLDLSLIVCNAFTWVVVFVVVAIRVHDALIIHRLGSRVSVDVYQLERLKPFGRSAIRDVLVVMGALALMPLQALDAEFRWVNYQYGLLIGLAAATLFFLLPQTGVRRAIESAKADRIGTLQRQIDAADRSDVATLEALVAHRDRIRQLSSWPLDLSLVSRVAVYLVIPPLAWVGAAVVEDVVQRFLD